MTPTAEYHLIDRARLGAPGPALIGRPPVADRGTTLGPVLVLLVATFATLAAGCSHELKPIFETLHPPLAWPDAPAPPRITYLGQLRRAADLKPPPKPFEALGALLLGPKQPQNLYGPRSVICDGGGQRVWVADPGGRCLHLFDMEQRTYQKITTAGGAPLLSPVDLCAGDAGSIYVCDSEAVAIYRLSARSGELLESLRLPEDIRRPVALYYDRRGRELFVVDVVAHDIKVLGPQGGLRRILGQRGDDPGQFNFPCDITADGDDIWVVDAGNSRVQRLTSRGDPIIAFGNSGDAPGDMALPKSVALDSDGHVYVVDARFENVQVFNRSGDLLLFFGEEGGGPGEFWLPAGISIDANDRIWICDSYNRRLQVFQYVKRQVISEAADPAPRQEGVSP